jgi:hypothetical protein
MMPNPITSLDAAMSSLFFVVRHCRRASDVRRSARHKLHG